MKLENKLLYSILFLKGRIGSDVKELASLFKVTQKKMKEIVEELETKLINDKSPIVLKWSDDKVRLTISSEISKILSEKMDKTINIKLSKSVIETLTIIAYKQPVIKPEIERIRGVSADYAIAKLLELELIEDAGKSDLPGQPRLYVSTPAFLELFDLKSLKELPSIKTDFEVEKKGITNLFDYES